jgi:hypothetical protein
VADISGILGLEPEILTRAAEMTEAYATTWLAEPRPADGEDGFRPRVWRRGAGDVEPRVDIRARPQSPFAAATSNELRELRAGCLAMAACYRVVVDQDSARVLFAAAANEYTWLGNSFSLVCAVIANKGAEIDWSLLEGDRSEPHHVLIGAAFAVMLGLQQELGIVAIIERWQAEWAAGSFDVGDAGLPIGLYANALLPALWGVWRGQISELPTRRVSPKDSAESLLRPLLARADEQTTAAVANEYQWRNLLGDMPPVDPDLIATCAVVLGLRNSQGDGTASGRFRGRRMGAPMQLAVMLRDLAQ